MERWAGSVGEKNALACEMKKMWPCVEAVDFSSSLLVSRATISLHISGFCKLIKRITQLSTPTHAQLQVHRLKLIKNHLKTPTCFGLLPSSGSYNILAKVTII